MKKIMLSLVLGILVLGFVAASMSGMAVSVSEKEAKAFSFQEKDYSVEVQNQDDGTVDLEINGEKVEDVEEGDVVVVNGAEVEVTNVRKPWFFRRSHKVDLNVMETEATELESEEEIEDEFDSTSVLPPTSAATISANSCNADEVCEVDILKIQRKGVSRGWRIMDYDGVFTISSFVSLSNLISIDLSKNNNLGEIHFGAPIKLTSSVNVSACGPSIKGTMVFVEDSLEDRIEVCMKVYRNNNSYYDWERLDPYVLG